MRKATAWMLHIILFLLPVSQAGAGIITWRLDFGPPLSSAPNVIQEGSLVVSFDDDNVRAVINQTEVKIKQWWVTDFVLVINGETFLPGPPRNPGTYPGVIAQELVDRQRPEDPFQAIGFDFDLENGGVFNWSLYSFIGMGNQPIFPDANIFDVTTPLGNLAGTPFWSNTVQGYRPDGTAYQGWVENWTVPEPQTHGLFLAGLGLIGLMANRRKKAKEAP